ncbi:four helix bundle protein [Aliifodinibius salipaludis]|uniref:Four helix bundle protein n=1 Tax=Fodinibius salipaludis TaxID=2032627 RepID=A0A2A2G8K1_9BACT|nr:four helix bundle protein [Aliifodinibius salipaludis]PAU93179.1 four helix bundle protein [Aliifodinibius salipaludis]
MGKFSFEKLDVWQKSKDFTVKIYQITSEFPPTEKFGLVTQLRRASISVSSNLAEGSSRTSNKDQARFYIMAYSSAVEILNQLIISKDLDFLSEEVYKELRSEIEHVTSMINRLHKATDNY